MNLTLLKCKLHGATVTDANLNYEGSIGIPRDLMDAAGLLPHEQVDVLNFRNGERFTTYVLEYPAASGHIVINGPAAHKAKAGDKVIVIAYAAMDEAAAKKFTPKVVLLDAQNKIKHAPDIVMLDPKRKAT
ncbi:MAG: aspartate 1-decarboxylase [Alphaproteobacteria bacterium]